MMERTGKAKKRKKRNRSGKEGRQNMLEVEDVVIRNNKKNDRSSTYMERTLTFYKTLSVSLSVSLSLYIYMYIYI